MPCAMSTRIANASRVPLCWVTRRGITPSFRLTHPSSTRNAPLSPTQSYRALNGWGTPFFPSDVPGQRKITSADVANGDESPRAVGIWSDHQSHLEELVWGAAGDRDLRAGVPG